MDYLGRIKRWTDWPGWRRHAPAAGSVGVHIVAVAVLAGVLAASGKTLPAPVEAQRERFLEVALVPLPELETASDPEMRPPPPRPAPRAPGGDTVPVVPPVAKPRKEEQEARVAPDAPAEARSSGDGGVVLGPSPFAEPRTGGLEGLASNDRCKSLVGPKPKECATDWAGKLGGAQASLIPQSKEEKRQYFAEFMPKCPYNVGCEGGEWISNNGTRSVAGTQMAGGPASLGGMNETVGRLGFNPDHVDPGFGD